MSRHEFHVCTVVRDEDESGGGGGEWSVYNGRSPYEFCRGVNDRGYCLE